mgnify:CR=1 FL=1
MSITKVQAKIIDELKNGGHIWIRGRSVWLAKVTGSRGNGDPLFQSEKVNHKTFCNLVDKDLIEKSGKTNTYILKP